MPNYQMPQQVREDILPFFQSVSAPSNIEQFTTDPRCPICQSNLLDSKGNVYGHYIDSFYDKMVEIGGLTLIQHLMICSKVNRTGYGVKPFPYFFTYVTVSGAAYFVQSLPDDTIDAILSYEREYFNAEYVFNLSSEIDLARMIRRGNYNNTLMCTSCGYTYSSNKEGLISEKDHLVIQKESVEDADLNSDVGIVTRYTTLCNRFGTKSFAYSFGRYWIFQAIKPDIKLKKHSEVKGEIPCPECNNNFFLKGTSEHKLEKSWLLGKTPNKKILCLNTGKSFLYVLPSGKDVSVLSLTVNKLAHATIGKTKIFWQLDSSETTTEDYTDYLDKSLMIGVELELDAKSNFDYESSGFRSLVERKFSTSIMSYHTFPPCKVSNCNSTGCWKHLPNNLIRAISQDGSIHGYEFVLYGANIRSEEFAKRLPLESMKELFMPTSRDGLHLHLLLVDHQVLEIPAVIARNIWQIFRFYYPGWVYLFGNTKPTFLRNSRYVPFKPFKESGLNRDFFGNVLSIQVAGGHANHANCGGLNLSNLKIQGNRITDFDMEIRTNDATVDLEQIVAARALAKALVLRSAQLSNFGIIKCTTDKELWSKVTDVIERLNRFAIEIEAPESEFMRESAVRMLRELSPFLSEFERNCVRSIIDKPVRDREPNQIAKIDTVFKKDTRLTVQLKKIITLGEETAESFDHWVSLTAQSIDKPEDEIRSALFDMKAFYDPYCKMVITKEI